MTKINKNLQIEVNARANNDNIIEGKGYRITLITPRLVRVESQRENKFLDQATLCFWNRDLGKVEHEVNKIGNVLEIKTEKAVFYFNERSKRITKVNLEGKIIPCTNRGNLLGTARTLDMNFGYKKLQNGIISKKGVSIVDDSGSLIFTGSEVKARSIKQKDMYIFAYGKDYRQAVKDFYKIAEQVPLLPRFALGNWWSRYKAYTQQEYMDLMTRFENEDIPFTVATVDMDWHWVDINNKFGCNFRKPQPFQPAGWTGYSWNTDLFPDRQFFLDWLHSHNYIITLNLHPAQGVRYFEDMYETMATKMGIDPTTKQTVKFDITDPNFINNYFEILHHPYEKEGVDFWWMDWQQGKKSAIKGLDPLWSLNHYHFLDNAKDGKRPMLLSRYSGLGAHRYPVGFSGDTVANWCSLKFQPYFTANAANAGYGWWSHDIGGHTFGVKDDELYLRWCQFGVFSPINRLHSTSHDLQGKEPWFCRDEVKNIVSDFLRLRHKMLPYLYTMNYRSHKEGIAICEPMYYSYPDCEEAYTVRNQYMFGSELLVAPIVSKNLKELNKGKVEVWLPKGRYTDIFTSRVYNGDRYVTMFRDWTSIPVLAKEGAIIPFGNYAKNESDNPSVMELYVYRGNNSFTLYEDDGITNDYKDGKAAFTTFSVNEENTSVSFTIDKVAGDSKATCVKRTYHIKFRDIVSAKVSLEINGQIKEIEFSQDIAVTIEPTDTVKIKLENCTFLTNPSQIESAKEILSRYQRGNLSKMIMYRGMGKITDTEEFKKALKKSTFPYIIKLACQEVMEN